MRDLLRSEPVRVRGYAILGIVLGYAVAKGYVDASTQDVVLTSVGLATGILAVENTRSKVSPVA